MIKMLLPFELQEYIIDFLPFEKTLNYSFISNRKYNPHLNANYKKIFCFDIYGNNRNVKWKEIPISNPEFNTFVDLGFDFWCGSLRNN